MRDQAVKLTIIVRSPIELEERLLGGQLDVAIGYFWHRVPTLQFTPLFIERQVAYCSKSHPVFAKAGSLTASDARELDWVWRSYPLPETGLAEVPRNITAVSDNMEATAMLILSGHHLGFLPEHFAAPFVAQKHLAALNRTVLQYEATFHVVTRQRRELNDIAKTFLDDLRAVHLNQTSP
jgi:DNA-binding transcriptional LysR family regulator